MWSYMSRKNRSGSPKAHTPTTKPVVEVLEDRIALSGFVDDFEAPTLDPFWTSSVQSGSITFPSTAKAHGGSQSMQFNSTATSAQKNISLRHIFATPTYGRFSVWVYDTGADQSSSNYLELRVGSNSQGMLSHVIGYDYDAGPTNGGHYYASVPGSGDINTPIDRTEAWHKFTLDIRPDASTVTIDGVTVASGGGGTPVDYVVLNMFAPFWRPAWTGYFDDFEFVPYGQVDVKPTALAWNTAQGGVDFNYKVEGGDLTQDTTAALYWSADDTFDPQTDTLAYDTPIERKQGDYGPFNVPNTILGTPPAGATHLLAVTDPPTPEKPKGLVEETDETNNILALPISDIVMKGATMKDSKSVTFKYDIKNAPIDGFHVRIYRSADAKLDAGDILVGSDDPAKPLDGSVKDDHEGTVTLKTPLVFDPDHDYILVKADPDGSVIETNEKNNSTRFRKYVLGVVTHGQAIPIVAAQGWVEPMARALKTKNDYDDYIPFYWKKRSYLPLPGMATAAGDELFSEVLDKAHALVTRPGTPKGSVVDIHFIGHSRGAGVISRALQDLVGTTIPELQGGYFKMTMLDPHPANNHGFSTGFFDTGLDPLVDPFTRQIVLGYTAFQSLANDPLVVVPPNVQQAEIYFQRTRASRFSPFSSQRDQFFINLWGESIDTVINQSGTEILFLDLTPRRFKDRPIGHTEVHDWYQRFVIDEKKAASPVLVE